VGQTFHAHQGLQRTAMDNHAVVHLQLKPTGYWFSINNRPGRMLEDADHFSRLGADIHIDPVLIDYLSFARQLCSENTPEQGDIHTDNLPGRRKKAKADTEVITLTNLAQVHLPEQCEFHYDENWMSLKTLRNIVVVFNTLSEAQPKFNKHFCYATESAVALQAHYWWIFQPKFGHFLQSAQKAAILFDVVIAVKSDQACRNMLQNYWKIQIMRGKLTDMVTYFTSTINPPRIQGYYISCPETLSNQSSSQSLSLQQSVISLLLRCSGLEIFVMEYRNNFSDYSVDNFIQTLSAEGWKISKQTIKFLDISDRFSS
jgi:hypothetical protein